MDMTAAPTPAGNSADEMDAMHKAGIDTFVANAGKDTTFWRKPMAFTMDGDVKVFELTCTEGKWEIEPATPWMPCCTTEWCPGPKFA